MKLTSIVAIVVVIIVVIVVAGAALVLFYPNNNQNNNPTPPAGQRSSNTTATIQNFEFRPTPLTISSGTTVTWTNMDSVDHTVTSDPGSSEVFDSGNIAPGATYSHTFNNAGTFNYHCTIHPDMHGQVTVS